MDLDDAECRAEGPTVKPKVYRIDLSLPPSERYWALARDFCEELLCLYVLADDLIHQVLPSPSAPKYVMWSAKYLLRGLYYKDETEELKGISKASGIELSLLVAFNVLLDVLMGCSSGGIRVSEDGKISSPTRILHYRTLDWMMPELRQLVVQLEFVRGPKGPVIARSITYAGYVGVLTGVKPGLSISLNYRCVCNDNSKKAILRLRWHQLAVMFGFRPSLPSTLRRALFAENQSYEQTIKQVESVQSTVAYLIFSNGQHVSILEKDQGPSVRHDSDDFLAVTNNDVKAEEPAPPEPQTEGEAEAARAFNPHADSPNLSKAIQLMDKLVMGESVGRRQAMVDRYNTCKSASRSKRYSSFPKQADVIEWLRDWPITNELTHYGVVMDPTHGTFVHALAWPEPAKRGRK